MYNKTIKIFTINSQLFSTIKQENKSGVTMKRLILGLILLSISLSAMQMGHKNFRTVSMDKATMLKDGKQKMFCSVCGMTLPMFYKTNHAAKHNHKQDQYCSVVCMVEDMVVGGKTMSNFKVVDNTTLKFIPSKDAYYVVGSKKPGTMSMVSKYAFGTIKAAKEFKHKFGGKIIRFGALIEMVKKAQAKDMEATKKRQAKAIKKGAMMYKKMCQKTNKHFTTTAQAKAFLKSSQICGNINGKKLQAIGMYLVKR